MSAAEVCAHGFERMIKACGWRQGALKAVVSTALAKCREPSPSERLSKGMMEALSVACTSKSNSLIEIALDVFCELLAKDAIISVFQIAMDSPSDLVTIDEVLQLAYPAIIDGNSQVKTNGLKVMLMAASGQRNRMHFDSVVLCVKTCIDVYARTDSSANQTAASATLTQILTTMLSRYDSDTVSSISTAAEVPQDEVVTSVVDGLVSAVCKSLGEVQMEIGNDVLRSLDTLLRLSMKKAAVDGADNRMQVFSREMVLLMLRRCGPKFKSSPAVIELFNEYLIGPFIANAVSPSPNDFRLAISILSTIVMTFSSSLSNPLSLAINHLMNAVLEGSLRAETHILILLELLSFLSSRSHVLGDLFVPKQVQSTAPKLFFSVLRMLQTCISFTVEKSSSTSLKAHPIIVQAVRTLGLIAASLHLWIDTLPYACLTDSRRPSEDSQLNYPEGDTSSSRSPRTRPIFLQDVTTQVIQCERPQTPVDLSTANHGIVNLLNQGWPPALAALSQATEHCAHDAETWKRCIDSYKEFVLLSMTMDASVCRQTFVQALVKSTKLFTVRGSMSGAHASPPVLSLTANHRYVIAIVLDLAVHNCDQLEESWDVVLYFFWNLEKHAIRTEPTLKDQFQQIYNGSGQLCDTAIVHFCTASCSVSQQELAIGGTKMLDRLANVMVQNLHRAVPVIQHIWSLLRVHLTQSSTTSSASVCDSVVAAIAKILNVVLSAGAPKHIVPLQGHFVDIFISIMGPRHDPAQWHRVVYAVSELIASNVESIVTAWHDILVVMTFASKEKSLETVLLILKMAYIICPQKLDTLQLNEIQELVTVADVLAHSEFPYVQLHAVVLLCIIIKDACDFESRSQLIPNAVSSLLISISSVVPIPKSLVDHCLEAIITLAHTQGNAVWMKFHLTAFENYLNDPILKMEPSQCTQEYVISVFRDLSHQILSSITDILIDSFPGSSDSLGIVADMLMQAIEESSCTATVTEGSICLARLCSIESSSHLAKVFSSIAALLTRLAQRISESSAKAAALIAIDHILIRQVIRPELSELNALISSLQQFLSLSTNGENIPLESLTLRAFVHVSSTQRTRFPSLCNEVLIRSFDHLCLEDKFIDASSRGPHDSSLCLVLSAIHNVPADDFWKEFCSENTRPHRLFLQIESDSEPVRECIKMLLSARVGA